MAGLLVSGTILFVLCCVVRGNSFQEEKERRQVHHTHAPHSATHSPPSDPLAAWMSSTSSRKPNVVFLVADDLRPKLGSYLETNMVTPNLDHLAGKSVMFKQAFAQVALCSPSRTSFLTGRRPDTTHVYDLNTYFRTVAGNFTTLPQFFKNHGYYTQNVGKIFHSGMAASGDNDKHYSWSSRPYSGNHLHSDVTLTHRAAVQAVDESQTGKLQDTTIADYAVNFLKQRAHNRDQPFFLAVGFHKPHLPWVFPKEYLDLYPLSNIHLAQHRTRPAEMPDIAWSSSGELYSYQDMAAIHHGNLSAFVVPDNVQKDLRQGYSAAVSYMDAQVGRVLRAVSQNGFDSDTIISFIGDHGWQLGENAEWCKHTNFDMALRIPMMLYVPGVTSVGNHFDFIDALAPGFKPHAHGPGGAHATEELVEAIDLYPTLAELSGLPVPPPCPHTSLTVATCSEGTSLVPLVKQVRNLTGHNGRMQWKQAAFSQYRRGNGKGAHSTMGYTVRTKTHRYTEWVSFNNAHYQPDFSQVTARELYDHSNDQYEFHNLAEVTSQQQKVAELSGILRNGWRKTQQDYLSSLH